MPRLRAGLMKLALQVSEGDNLSMVRVNGGDVRANGLAGSMASNVLLELVVDSRGGRVSGLVLGPDGNVWSGASPMLIPDPPQGRLQSYRETAANEFGQFQIRGIPLAGRAPLRLSTIPRGWTLAGRRDWRSRWMRRASRTSPSHCRGPGDAV